MFVRSWSVFTSSSRACQNGLGNRIRPLGDQARLSIKSVRVVPPQMSVFRPAKFLLSKTSHSLTMSMRRAGAMFAIVNTPPGPSYVFIARQPWSISIGPGQVWSRQMANLRGDDAVNRMLAYMMATFTSSISIAPRLNSLRKTSTQQTQSPATKREVALSA